MSVVPSEGAVTRADPLRRAVRALAGLDPAALDAVTPDAMRAVMVARGWRMATTVRMLDGQVAAEVWDHDTASGAGRRPGAARAVPSVHVRVLPSTDADEALFRASDWAWAVATRHGDVAPAEVLAEALAWGAP